MPSMSYAINRDRDNLAVGILPLSCDDKYVNKDVTREIKATYVHSSCFETDQSSVSVPRNAVLEESCVLTSSHVCQ